MARQLTPLGRLLLVFCGLGLVGYGLYRYGAFQKLATIVAPQKKPEGTVSKADFGSATTATTPAGPAATVPASKAVPGGGSRLARPIKVAIVTWGGYAGGIVANGGFAPNRDNLAAFI